MAKKKLCKSNFKISVYLWRLFTFHPVTCALGIMSKKINVLLNEPILRSVRMILTYYLTTNYGNLHDMQCKKTNPFMDTKRSAEPRCLFEKTNPILEIKK